MKTKDLNTGINVNDVEAVQPLDEALLEAVAGGASTSEEEEEEEKSGSNSGSSSGSSGSLGSLGLGGNFNMVYAGGLGSDGPKY